MDRQIVLDVDTGNDDAVAIAMAAGNSGLQVLGCTTVRGNLPLEETTDNTLRVLDAIERTDIPVYAGLARPFAPRPFPFVQGRSAGLMHESVLPLSPSTRRAEAASAIDWLISTLRSTTDPITVVALAPLTNIAAAITAAPEIVDAIDEVVLMGGGHQFGNRTPAAEFNIYADPIAADVVFQAGFQRVTVMPLDATHDVVTGSAMIADLKALGTKHADAAAAVLEFYIHGHDASHPMDTPSTAPVHDALCVSYLMDPSVVDLRNVAVSVDTTGFHNFGRTTVDINRRSGSEPNVWWAFSADQERFDQTMLDALRA